MSLITRNIKNKPLMWNSWQQISLCAKDDKKYLQRQGSPHCRPQVRWLMLLTRHSELWEAVEESQKISDRPFLNSECSNKILPPLTQADLCNYPKGLGPRRRLLAFGYGLFTFPKWSDCILSRKKSVSKINIKFWICYIQSENSYHSERLILYLYFRLKFILVHMTST